MKRKAAQTVRSPGNPWRLYLDTSVIGGCFDDEFAEDSRRVIAAVLDRKARLLFTEVLEAELLNAPESVRRLFEELPDSCRERVAFTAEVESLAREYVARGVVPEVWLEDCRHVAAATVARADAVVSWNFKHIVKLDKIKGYNQVNLLNGYGVLTIVSPKEVSFDE
jgi:predicted nucleic acid-binding protein